MSAVTKYLKVLGITIILLGAWIFVAGIDQSGFDDQGLIFIAKQIPNEDNGFQEIAYTQEDDFGLIPHEEISEKFAPLIYHEKWNEDYIQQVLKEHRNHIDNVITASKYERFKFQETDVVDGFPSIAPVITIFRLLLLRSMTEAKAGNYDNSIFLAERAIVFSQQVKTEENHQLLSYMFGQYMQYEALLWMHHLATEYGLNKKQYSNLLNVFNHIPSYKEDTFRKVFSNEFIFARELMRRAQKKTFSERWKDWENDSEWWKDPAWLDDGVSDKNNAEEMFDFLQVFFPRYSLHLNSASEKIAKFYLELANLSDGTCEDTAFLADKPEYDVTWSDLAIPNLIAKSWTTSESEFSNYFFMRCYSHAHMEGIRTIVALKSYEQDSGTLPNTLDELIPRYLPELPVDPFDGSYLKYSKLNKWVYSVGDNFIDNGGSIDAYYVRRCKDEKACAPNPTFPISPNSVTYELS